MARAADLLPRRGIIGTDAALDRGHEAAPRGVLMLRWLRRPAAGPDTPVRGYPAYTDGCSEPVAAFGWPPPPLSSGVLQLPAGHGTETFVTLM